MERTSEEKILGGITHLAIFFSWIGLIANVILYVIYRSKSAFVASHVKQSIGLQVIGMLVGTALGFLFGLGMIGGFGMGMSYGMGAAVGAAALGALLILAVGIAAIVLAILAAIKGFQGQDYRHPLFGNWLAGLGE